MVVKNFSAQRGETILEFVFAATVVLVALTAFLSVFLMINRTQSVDRNLLVATQLAREGVEVVRSIRDSNWLAGRAWSDGLVAADGDRTAVVWPNVGQQANPTLIDFTPNTLADAPLYDHLTYWDHDPTGASSLGFDRLITLAPLCTDDLSALVPVDGQGCDPEKYLGVKVTAVVGWHDSDRARQYELVEYLYDWR